MAGLTLSSAGFVGSLGSLGPVAVAGTNQALQFVAASVQNADLLLAGTGTALTGSAWSIELRVRLDAAVAAGSYLVSRMAGPADEYAIIYNFVANTVEFFAGSPAIRMPLTITTPPGAAFQTVRFSFDGTTLSGFLNGVPAGTQAIATPTATQGVLLRLGCRADTAKNNPSSATIDYLRITSGATSPVLLELNETAPPYANTGTAGGTLTLSSPAPASVVV